MEWSTAVKEWGNRLLSGESLIAMPTLFPAEAEAALDVFKQLRVVDAPGAPTIGEVAEDWVLDFARAIFGSYDTESGHRLITEFFMLIPKKNGKSTMAAAIMLTFLIRNWRQSAELIILAPTIEVAQNAYNPARDMVKHDEDLDALFNVQDHTRTITHRQTGATLKVVAADSKTVGGKKASFILIDEVHLFGSMREAENMLREATGGLASRPEGCIIYLTTQSDRPPAGIFKQKLNYARRVRDGLVEDNRFLPVLYEFPKEFLEQEAHLQVESFGLVNPNYGVSVSRAFLEREFEKAKEDGAEALAGFLSKYLNVEIGVSLLTNRWAGAEFWEAASKASYSLSELITESEVVCLGIDGGGLDDLLGFYAIGRTESGQKLGWGYAWAHPSVLERRKEIAPALQDFAKAGDLTLVKKVGEDMAELAQMCEQVFESGKLYQIGVDPMGLGSIEEALDYVGIEADELITNIPQGWKLGSAIKTTERWLADGSFNPAKQPLMGWSVGNARIEPRANSILITKQASGSAKIDPVIAMLNAATLMALNPESQGLLDDFLDNPLIL